VECHTTHFKHNINNVNNNNAMTCIFYLQRHTRADGDIKQTNDVTRLVGSIQVTLKSTDRNTKKKKRQKDKRTGTNITVSCEDGLVGCEKPQIVLPKILNNSGELPQKLDNLNGSESDSCREEIIDNILMTCHDDSVIRLWNSQVNYCSKSNTTKRYVVIMFCGVTFVMF